MQPHHLTLATVGRHTLFPDRADLLRAVRTLARVGSDRLWLFALVDDHVHVVVHADRAGAGYLGSALSRAFAASGAPPLAAAHVRPVQDRGHLESLVGYLVKQPLKHGLVEPAAHWPGTCAPDLLGARVLPGFDPTAIARALPRYDIGDAVLRATGTTVRAAAPIEADGWTLAHAAASALPGEAGPRGAAARVVWAHLVSGQHRGLRHFGPPPEVARGRVPERTWQWLLHRTPDPRLLAATLRAASLQPVRAKVPATEEAHATW